MHQKSLFGDQKSNARRSASPQNLSLPPKLAVSRIDADRDLFDNAYLHTGRVLVIPILNINRIISVHVQYRWYVCLLCFRAYDCREAMCVSQENFTSAAATARTGKLRSTHAYTLIMHTCIDISALIMACIMSLFHLISTRFTLTVWYLQKYQQLE